MSREIPVTVHPEFKQGKPRIFSRSLSLPNGPKLKLVVETTSNQREASTERSAHENTQTTDDSTTQRKNGNNQNQQYKLWKCSLPESFQRVQKPNEDESCEQPNHTERKEQRRRFFRENPFVGDLQKAFEDHYSSRSALPVRLGRRNTYSARSLRETLPSAPKMGKISLLKTSFSIPIQVEVDEKVKDGNDEGEEGSLRENKVIEADGKIKDACGLESVQDEEETTKEEDDYTVLNIDNAGAVGVDEKKNYVDEDLVKGQDALGESNFNYSEDVREEITNDKTNTEQGEECTKEYTDKGEELRGAESLPLEFSIENESKDKLLTIQNILKKAEKLEKEVLGFTDNSKTKAYLAIEENLTRLLIELDGIEANRAESIRLARKRAVQQLQRALTQLEENILCRTVQNNNGKDKDWSYGTNRCESI